MKTNIVRSLALLLSVCVGQLAFAQYGAYTGSAYNYNPYAPMVPQQQVVNQPVARQQAPVQYPTNYRPQTQFYTVAAPQGPTPVGPPPANYSVPGHGAAPGHHVGGDAVIGPGPVVHGHGPAPGPAPVPDYHHAAPPAHVVAPAPAPAGNCATGNCGGGQTYTYQPNNIYVEAASSPTCGGTVADCGTPSCSMPTCYSAPTQIQPWFASADILFLDRDDNYDAILLVDDAAPATTRLSAKSAGQDFALGYTTTVGRYFCCGKYGISATWMHINSESGSADISPAAAGDYRANFRNWDRLYYDLDADLTHDNYGVPATDESFYGYFDRADRYYVSRDSTYYGLEVNLTGFGIGGAARAGRPSCGSSCGNSCGGGCGNACGGCNNQCCNNCCAPPQGCGGICGPMIPSCSCRLQMSWTGGFRWFHFEDQFSFAARSERAPAAPVFMDTFTYDVDAENELFGLQIGGRLAYCCGCRTSVYGGVKAGLYANDATIRERFYSTTAPIYATDLAHGYPSYADRNVNQVRSDTGLASLVEIDLGIGYRVCKCWTLHGGYRVLAVSGVATALGNLDSDPANLGADSAWLDSNLILHGGYGGVCYNW